MGIKTKMDLLDVGIFNWKFDLSQSNELLNHLNLEYIKEDDGIKYKDKYIGGIVMSKFNSTQSLGEIVADFPKAAEIFKEYKVDYCCGGYRTVLEAAALEKYGFNEKEVIEKVNNLYEEYQKNSSKDKDYREVPTNELVDHIVNDHHGYLWAELPKISRLTTTILRVHGPNHPELAKVHKLFHTVKMELEGHLAKEESIQYPAIEKFLASNSKNDLENAVNIIDELETEHTNAGEILRELREVTNDYALPEDACGTYEMTYSKLQEMEGDLFQHIHLENNILFPRLRELNK